MGVRAAARRIRASTTRWRVGCERAAHVGAMPRFLAIHAMPAGDWKEQLARLARHAAEHGGVDPMETFYSADRATAYTLYEAPDAETVRALHRESALPEPDVLRTEQVHTDLLHVRRRAR